MWEHGLVALRRFRLVKVRQNMPPKKAFISYSHDSPDHKARVAGLSAALRRDGVDCRIDQYVEAGPEQGWPLWTEGMIDWADFVLVICTEEFLRRSLGASPREAGKGVGFEIRLIYQEIYEGSAGEKFIPIVFQSVDRGFIPKVLRSYNHYVLDAPNGYAALYRRLTGQITPMPPLGPERTLATGSVDPLFPPPGPIPCIFCPSRLPDTAHRHLLGRERELRRLDEAWEDPSQRLMILVAWGGVGKTALVKHWMGEMSATGWRGAERVFDWSFFSGGSGENVVSGDAFIDAALRWFDDSDPNRGTPWEKGERLARLVSAHRTLLVLDGLEPLQNPPGPDAGKIRHQAVGTLLKGLSSGGNGLCLITSRERLSEFEHLGTTVAPQIDLDRLSPEAGAELLQGLGVVGPEVEVLNAVEEAKGHPLTLNLLGNYLRKVHGGDVTRRGEVGIVIADGKQGSPARKVMEAYERWLGEGRDLAILRLLGLFDGPADMGALAVLRNDPPIPGLTVNLAGIGEADWEWSVSNLVECGLVTRSKEDGLDTHPLVREHFAKRIANDAREAHRRLYHYRKDSAPRFLETFDNVKPLLDAVRHACEAGLEREAFSLYRNRISGGKPYFLRDRLGALGADLETLRKFFPDGWERGAALPPEDEGFALTCAGLDLRMLGRLDQACGLFRQGKKTFLSAELWESGANASRHLCQAYLTSGQLEKASKEGLLACRLVNRKLPPGGMVRVSSIVALADVWHQQGKLRGAAGLFGWAEREQALDPRKPLLHWIQGYRFCDFLLSMHSPDDNRAAQVLDHCERIRGYQAQRRFHVGNGLRLLIQGRAHGLLGDAAAALQNLDRAVEELRAGNQREFLARSLIFRASQRAECGQTEEALEDLREAEEMTRLGGMKLHWIDALLCRCGLRLDQFRRQPDSNAHRDAARLAEIRADLARGKALVKEIGYHRRNREIADLESRLAADFSRRR